MQAARLPVQSRSPVLQNPDAEEEFLQKWNSEIDRAVRHRTWVSKWGFGDIEDFKQEVRIRLLVLYRARLHNITENYVRKVIKNAISNALRDEAHKLPLSSPQVFPLSPDRQTEEMADSVAHRESAETLLQRKSLLAWVGTLPGRIQKVYELLYQLGCSQLEAAQALGISQPRIVQLHKRLIEAARRQWG